MLAFGSLHAPHGWLGDPRGRANHSVRHSPVVLTSGYDEARVMAGDHPEKPQAFLSKPYQMAELEEVLSRAMARAAQIHGIGDT